MPEGDSIRRDAARLGPLLVGRRILAAASRWPGIVRALEGVTVLSVEPLGKNLLLALDDGTTIRVHRGMTGRWGWYPAGRAVRVSMGFTSLRLDLEEGTAVAIHAPTVERFRTRELPIHRVVAALGPDVLADGFDPAAAATRARASDQPTVGEALLDQRVACGIGNIFRCEALFARRQDPFAAPAHLGEDTLTALYAEAAAQMRASVAGAPRPQQVYGRARRPCPRCATPIAVRDLGRDLPRKVWWCPSCQSPLD